MSRCRLTRHFAVLALISAAAVPAWADHPSIGFGPGGAGPIVTVAADTLPAGRATLGLRVEHGRFDAFSDGELERLAAQDKEVHSVDSLTSLFLGAGYGVTDRLTLGAHIPYVWRTDIREGHQEDGAPEVHVHGDSEGLGDLTVLAQYRFAGAAESPWRASALLGVKTPTGRTDVKDDGGERFEAEHQPGSGSWDPLFGLAARWQRESLSLDASGLYTWVTEGAQDTDLGDLLAYNLALSYRLEKTVHAHAEGAHAGGTHVPLTWDLVLEANGESRRKQQVDGTEDPSSGGHTVFLSPGVRLTVAEAYAAFLSWGFPVVQNLNGEQHDTEWRLIGGASASF